MPAVSRARSDINAAVQLRWIWLAAPALAAAALLAIEFTEIDLMVQRWFFDATSGEFPLRHTFLFDTLLHHWTKYVVALIACLAIAGLLLTWLLQTLKPYRQVLLLVALSLALAPATVSTLKLASPKHCPWDIEEFGGMLPYTRLFETTPPSIKPGHCFPAGHASTGYALLVFYFTGIALQRRWLAVAGLTGGLVLGTLLGFGRMAQGAHFLSHTLWTGVICWIVITSVYCCLFGYRTKSESPR